jgi:hypothetical protein
MKFQWCGDGIVGPDPGGIAQAMAFHGLSQVARRAREDGVRLMALKPASPVHY